MGGAVPGQAQSQGPWTRARGVLPPPGRSAGLRQQLIQRRRGQGTGVEREEGPVVELAEPVFEPVRTWLTGRRGKRLDPQLVAVGVGLRTPHHGRHVGKRGEAADAVQNSAELAEFGVGLRVLRQVLIAAAATAGEMRANRLRPAVARGHNAAELPAHEVGVYGAHFHLNPVTDSRKRDEDHTTLVRAADAVAAEGDVEDLQFKMLAGFHYSALSSRMGGRPQNSCISGSSSCMLRSRPACAWC